MWVYPQMVIKNYICCMCSRERNTILKIENVLPDRRTKLYRQGLPTAVYNLDNGRLRFKYRGFQVSHYASNCKRHVMLPKQKITLRIECIWYSVPWGKVCKSPAPAIMGWKRYGKVRMRSECVVCEQCTTVVDKMASGCPNRWEYTEIGERCTKIPRR